MNNHIRSLPSINELLSSSQGLELINSFGRKQTLEAFRIIVDETRSNLRQGNKPISQAEICLLTQNRLQLWFAQTLTRVVNATGVVLHTNLGRAPLSKSATQAVRVAAENYMNLEFDLEEGGRGSRLDHPRELLKRITGSEDAMVVNNNAAAIMLALAALAKQQKVVIARSQLVEIGGGFRIPEILRQSGAELLEVGTTNRVHLSDFEDALSESPTLFMRAHHSNFRIIGFTSEPEISEMIQLAHQAGILFLDDIGSGALVDTSQYGLSKEPMVQESIQAGADLVCFSGDKLLGGPQAGILVGREDLIRRLKKHPLARAIRADKLCLAALSATLLHYLRGDYTQEVPIWRMIAMPLQEIRSRAEAWVSALGSIHAAEVMSESTIGGGSLPGDTLPTWVLALSVNHPNLFLERLRQSQVPIIARTVDDRVVFDPRTVLPEQEPYLLGTIQSLLSN